MQYAVGYLNFYDNDLKLNIVIAAGGWKSALIQAGYIDLEIANTLSDDMEEAKQQAMDQDWTFNVEAI